VYPFGDTLRSLTTPLRRHPVTITEQLDHEYAQGSFAVIITQTKLIPVRNRNMIREAKGGVEVQHGKRWLYAFAYQVKFAH